MASKISLGDCRAVSSSEPNFKVQLRVGLSLNANGPLRLNIGIAQFGPIKALSVRYTSPVRSLFDCLSQAVSVRYIYYFDNLIFFRRDNLTVRYLNYGCLPRKQ